MKVLFYNSPPFFLAHGGMQTLTEGLMREVAALGVEVEPQRWWDEKQKGDIIHHVGRAPITEVRLAHQKGMKVVMTDILSQVSSRGRGQLFVQKTVMDFARMVVPNGFLVRLGWEVYQEVDALVYAVEHDRDTAEYLFHADRARTHVIWPALESEQIAALGQPEEAGDYLVCLATIYPVKNNVLLARAAKLAGTPIVFLGKPFAEDDPYFEEFKKLADGKLVRYAGFAAGEAKNQWLRGARGFVLLSQFESGSNAVNEAAAAGLPLLLSDLPWANRVYPRSPNITFVSPRSVDRVAPALRAFYEQARRQREATFAVLTWRQAA